MRALPLLTAASAGASLLIAGCAADGPFPSLKPRAVEQELAAADLPRPPPPLLPDDPRLSARAAQLIGEARSGEAEFESAFGQASRAAARAGPRGSDSWVEAQQSLSRAEAARARTTAALAELDAFAVSQANAAPPVSAVDMERLIAAVAQVQALANRQQEQINRLRAGL